MYLIRKLILFVFMFYTITVEQVSEEIRAFQEELDHYLYEYERLIKRLETFVKMLNTGKGFNQKFDTEISLQ